MEFRAPATVPAIEALKRYPSDVISTISPNDGMHVHDVSEDATIAYFEHGRAALDAIRLVLLAAQKERVERILDMPSGYGRVMRFLKAEYPQAALTACDVIREGVDFCVETFGARALYGREDPAELETEQRFDLIWCGSLLTHVDAPLWSAFLDFFESVLEPEGVLVFTTNGRSAEAQLRDPELGEQLLKDPARRKLLRRYDRRNFGYADYIADREFRAAVSMPKRYGLSLARPSWVCGLVDRRPRLQLLTYMENRWSTQDVVACMAVDRVTVEDNPVRIPYVRVTDA
jgi:SAM-dependent methyltransferase